MASIDAPGAKHDYSKYPYLKKKKSNKTSEQRAINHAIQKQASKILKLTTGKGQIVKVSKAYEIVNSWKASGNVIPKTPVSKLKKQTSYKQKAIAFYESDEWRSLRYKALKLYGRVCCVCGAKPPDVILHVDHIKPRSLFPELELQLENLQILCKDCNLGKSNKDSIDWRVS